MANGPSLVRTYGDTDFITGLRAIAATMVVIMHTGAFSGLGPLGEAITSAGKYGVDVFFVISGFTVAKTFGEAANYRAYLLRRIFRIVPLYWLLITVGLVLAMYGIESSFWMQELGASPDFYNLLMHLSMISYVDYTVANSILGVEWTIPVEVFWYLALPLILTRINTPWRTLGAVLCLAVIALAMAYVSKKLLGTSQPVKWSPVAYGHWFFLGSLTYFLRARLTALQGGRLAIFAWLGAAMYLLAILLPFSGRGEAIGLSVALLLTCASPQHTGTLTRALTFGPMLFLGSISYSLYLVHPIVIALYHQTGIVMPDPFLTFLLVYGATVAISFATYVLVERPTNALGRALAKRQ